MPDSAGSPHAPSQDGTTDRSETRFGKILQRVTQYSEGIGTFLLLFAIFLLADMIAIETNLVRLLLLLLGIVTLFAYILVYTWGRHVDD